MLACVGCRVEAMSHIASCCASISTCASVRSCPQQSWLASFAVLFSTASSVSSLLV